MTRQRMSASTQRHQRAVEKFNRVAKVGSHVNVRLDSGELRTTRTRSEAQLLGGHTAVVWLEDIAGAYLLDRVTPLVERPADRFE